MNNHLIRIIGTTLFAIIATGAITAHAAPVVAITSPTATSKHTPPATLTLSATASDSGSTIAKVAFYQGATLIGTATAAPWSVTWNNVPTGQYRLTAKATNAKGASKTSAAVPILVDQPPTVALTSPANNSQYPPSANLTLSASAADSDGTVSKVDFYRNGTLIGSDTTAPYGVVWKKAAVGKYTLTAKATDNFGIASTSPPVAVTIGAAPNQPLSVALNATPANATAPATITLNATASDSDGSITKVEFYNGATLLGTATAAPYAYS